MLIDVQRFAEQEKSFWEELDAILRRIEADPDHAMDLAHLKRFHYLYERTSADLGKISTFASEREIRTYLESLVARAYGEIHETRRKPHRFSPIRWFFVVFPQTFRARAGAFLLSVMITLAGCTFGGIAVSIDPQAKSVIMPFPHLLMDPAERVKREEEAKEDRLAGSKVSFASELMTNNTKVSILTLAMGITYGIGTVILLFYNGIILGAVAVDYMLAGQTRFLLGWLMPHGVVEIPAILIAGQAGLVLAQGLIGRGTRAPLRVRLREITGDLVTLIGGVGCLLIWAGVIESFLSQYHEPVLPYAVKIGFGLLELVLLTVFLLRSGKTNE